MKTDHLSDKTINTLAERLFPGEVLLWCGCPKKCVILTLGDYFKALLCLPLLVFSLFMCFKLVTAQHQPLIFCFVGGAFVIIGVYAMFGRAIAETQLRYKTSYAITDKRIIIDYGYKTQELKSFTRNIGIPEIPTQSYDRNSIPKVHVKEYKSQGVGTISFGLPPVYSSAWGGRGGGSAINIYPQFDFIVDYELVSQILASNSACSNNVQR